MRFEIAIAEDAKSDLDRIHPFYRVNMNELETLDSDPRRQLMPAALEPVLVTDHQRPLLVVRSLADDDAADDLIARHPEFQESICRARQQAAEGQVYTLAELRAAYEATES